MCGAGAWTLAKQFRLRLLLLFFFLCVLFPFSSLQIQIISYRIINTRYEYFVVVVRFCNFSLFLSGFL